MFFGGKKCDEKLVCRHHFSIICEPLVLRLQNTQKCLEETLDAKETYFAKCSHGKIPKI